MDKVEKKRERGKNYTEQEKENLLEIVKQYLNVIENKLTDGTSVKLKNEVWEVITEEFNATAQSGIRNAGQLRLLYDSIKKKARKDKANQKVEIYKTGGGLNKFQESDSIGEKYLSMASTSGTQPILNIYDSTAPFDELLRNEGGVAQVAEEVQDQGSLEQCTENEPLKLPEKCKRLNYVSGVPHHKKNKCEEGSEKEKIKLKILQIRQEKEELSRDILKLEKQKLELAVKEKILQLRHQYGDEFENLKN
ncbi:uncharacterized protein LOC126883575 [Diabrotica virgifera virgifera]|uniref:Regulatory protein zeste n=1 Tax=Diabrotica virgifera virgifera TaxID=50390 RepID=A0ABM5K4R3_DIAVI|nr:uncharacterized protein LOC126883575 [Diabrotica virgifera virgifera]